MPHDIQLIRNFVEYVDLLRGDEKGEAQVFCDRLFRALQQFPLMTCESYVTMASDSSLSISTIRFLSFEETSAIRHHRISCCKPTHLVIAA